MQRPRCRNVLLNACDAESRQQERLAAAMTACAS